MRNKKREKLANENGIQQLVLPPQSADINTIDLLWNYFDKDLWNVLQKKNNILHTVLEKLVSKSDVQSCSSCPSN